MQSTNRCNSVEHLMARRTFFGGLAAGAGAVVGGLGVMARPAAATQLAKDQKRVLVVNLHGGVSQLETWDPKPGTNTGGPFRPIATSVPGMHICELLPHTAKLMHHLAIVRSVNIKTNDHGAGRYAMFTGRAKTPASNFPELGAVAAKTLMPDSSPLPGHIRITPKGRGGRANDAAYLGPKYASIALDDGKRLENLSAPEGSAATAEQNRQAFRRLASDQFTLKRRTAMTDAYMSNYEQAQQLMRRNDLFDVSKESEKDQARYGTHDFGRHCLLARRLLEGGITFVQVSHGDYDTHYDNFNFHIEQLGEFDSPFATLVADLAERDMLKSTLIVVLSEFGRTPTINAAYGRDHWGSAWSIALGGCRVQGGAIIGKTNENGTAVSDREVDHGNLFHTYLQAVGLDSTSNIDIGGRSLPMADPASKGAIKELLS